MSGIKINYSVAAAKARTVEDNAAKIEKILNDLVADMETNINDNVWHGASADGFRKAWGDSAAEFNSFVEFLKTIENKLDTASDEVKMYDETHQG